MIKRPPIVVVMGHVDHGKTTLLDNIRKENVAGKEAGGITQSIGAYEIEHGGERITFIDTPGHEAFSKMRSHGASVADLAVLVVAADDGIKPQTKEALSAIKSANIPFVVAINKTDLPTADVEKTKNELTQIEVYLEGRGGNISYQEISAKTGAGINDLLDLINLVAELEELTYDPNVPGEGVVISSARCKRRGVSVGVVIKNGTLKIGDEVFTESVSGKIKSLDNFLGKRVDSIKPSSPALVIGLCDLPNMGEELKAGQRPKLESPLRRVELESPLDKKELPPGNDIPVILKANETASLEALKDVISNLAIEPPLHIVGTGVGDIHENDANLAFCTGAVIVGFGVGMDKSSESIIRSQKTRTITASIIYELQKALEEYADEFAKKETGVIDILAVFGDSKGKQVVGGIISEGEVKNQSEFTIARGENEIGKGKITNLQSQKKDVPVVKEGSEAGLMVVSEIKIEKGDKLVFREEKLKS